MVAKDQFKGDLTFIIEKETVLFERKGLYLNVSDFLQNSLTGCTAWKCFQAVESSLGREKCREIELLPSQATSII